MELLKATLCGVGLAVCFHPGDIIWPIKMEIQQAPAMDWILFRTPITTKLKADFACFGYMLWGVVLPKSTYPPTKLDDFELLAVFSVCFAVLL